MSGRQQEGGHGAVHHHGNNHLLEGKSPPHLQSMCVLGDFEWDFEWDFEGDINRGLLGGTSRGGMQGGGLQQGTSRGPPRGPSRGPSWGPSMAFIWRKRSWSRALYGLVTPNAIVANMFSLFKLLTIHAIIY